MAPLSPLGTRGFFMWAGIYLCCCQSGFHVYVGPGWRGPFPDIASMELAASEASP